MNITNGTSTVATSTASITVEAIRGVLDQLKATDPVRMYMQREGFDPDAGGRIVFPEAQREVMYPFGDVPDYVMFSRLLTDQALLLRDPFTTMLKGKRL